MSNETEELATELVALKTLVVALFSLHNDRQIIMGRFNHFHSLIPGAQPLSNDPVSALDRAHKRLLDQISQQGSSL